MGECSGMCLDRFLGSVGGVVGQGLEVVAVDPEELSTARAFRPKKPWSSLGMLTRI